MVGEVGLDQAGLMGKGYKEEFAKAGLAGKEYTPLPKYDREQTMTELFEKLSNPDFVKKGWKDDPDWQEVAGLKPFLGLVEHMEETHAAWLEEWAKTPYDTSTREQIVGELKK